MTWRLAERETDLGTGRGQPVFRMREVRRLCDNGQPRRAAVRHPGGGLGGGMATGGGARGWQFLKRNDPYAEACRALTDPAPAFLDAPFPIRRQTGADLEAGPLGLLGWEDPLAANGPCSPIWAVAPMIEVAPAPADGPGLAEMARASGAALSGLRLADGALILKVERAGRARQLRFADGDGFDPHGGSFVPSLSFGPDWPRLNGRACELWRLVGGPAPLAGRGTGTGNF